MGEEEIHQLIEACIRNNRVAQESLYKHFYAEMFRTCQRYTDQPHDALTILNDAFLKVFRSISTYRTELGNFKSWLKTIVINTAIDHTRRMKNGTRFISIAEVNEPGDEDFHLAYHWKQEELLQHFSMLPAVTRVVLNLFAFDGYSHKDIAKELNITETTSRWHLSEARKKLKISLKLTNSNMLKHE